jgi:hypothetical protein
MNRRVLVGLLLLAGLGVALLALPDASDRPGGSTGSGGSTAAAPSTGSAARELAPSGAVDSCLPCHAAVVAEWRSSMHSQAFLDPQVRAPEQADDFRKTECLPCHAPLPVFQYGIEPETRVVERIERRHEGVDCLACHGLPDQSVAASRPGLQAPCRPVLREELGSQALCAPCHNQHATHDEWRASPAYAEGQSCIDCHMPRVLRAGSEAGAPRSGRNHGNFGGRDRDFALAGLALEHERTADGLLVRLVNRFAAHNLPTDSRNRALDLVVTLLDVRGAELPPSDPTPRHPGGERGTARLRFRNPYRASGDPNTQLPAGETASLLVPLPPEAARARLELHYKLQPWVDDNQAHWSLREEIDLR